MSYNKNDPTRVVVTEVNISFLNMIDLVVKFLFALIPAFLVVGLAVFLLNLALGGVLQRAIG